MEVNFNVKFNEESDNYHTLFPDADLMKILKYLNHLDEKCNGNICHITSILTTNELKGDEKVIALIEFGYSLV